jgi:hypothetical protein
MGQRNSGYERKPRDLYETPPEATEWLIPHLPQIGGTVWEPACATGKMLDVLGQHYDAFGTDIDAGQDFLKFKEAAPQIGAIITNPPFGRHAEKFIRHALELMRERRGVVAMLTRVDYDSAAGRRDLFDREPFAKKVVLTKRIVWFVEADGKPKASPSENHCWMIWDWRHSGPATLAYAPIVDEVKAKDEQIDLLDAGQ